MNVPVVLAPERARALELTIRKGLTDGLDESTERVITAILRRAIFASARHGAR
jgi:hypothetical protein